MSNKITLTFDDGSSHIYEGVPDDVTPEQVHARALKDFAGKNVKHIDRSKAKTSMLEDVKIGLAGAVNSMDTGITLAGRGLETLVGKERSIEDEDALFNSMKERKDARMKWANPNNAEQGLGGKVLGTVATLPAQIASMPGGSAERMADLVDKGESNSTAQRAGIADTALTMLALALPGASQISKAKGIVVGAGGNVATGAASDAYTNYIAATKATKDAYRIDDWEKRAQEGIIGAGFGYVGSKPASAAKASGGSAEVDAAKKFDEILAKRNETPIVPPEGGDGQQVIGRQFGGRDAGPFELQTQEGKVRGPELTAEQAPFNEPLGAGRHLMDNGKLATGMHPDVPTIDFMLRQELLQTPEIKASIDAFRAEDQRLQGEIDAKYAEIAEQAKFTFDYEGSKESIAMEHDALAKLSDELDQLQQAHIELGNKFQEGMEAMGIRNSWEATGLTRPLYEGKNKGIPIKRTFDARKPIEAAKLGAMFKKQGGYISKDLLDAIAGPGGIRRLLSDIGPYSLIRSFVGTYNEKSLASAVSESIDAKSHDYLVYMSPKDFKEYAHTRPSDYFSTGQPKELWRSIENGLDTPAGLGRQENFADIPHLAISSKGDIYQHNGRHRSDMLQKRGFDLMPVIITDLSRTNGEGPRIPRYDQNGNKVDPLRWPKPAFKFENGEMVTDISGASRQEMWNGNLLSEAERNQRVFGEESPTLDLTKDVASGKEDAWFNKGVAKKQQGSVDIEMLLTIATAGTYPVAKKIATAVKGALDSNSKVVADYKKQEAFNRATNQDIFINKGPTVEEAIDLIKNEPDLNTARNNFIGGAEMYAAWKNSAAIAATKIWVRTAKKLAELRDRENIIPLEREIKKLFRAEEAETVATILKKEMFNDTRLTEQELASLGLTERQRSVYDQMRRLFDEVYELQKSKMSPEDAKHFTMKDAYLASSWRGDWGAPIYKLTGKLDENGKPERKLVAWVKDTSKGRADMAVKKMLESEEGLVADKVEYKKGLANTDEATMVQSYKHLVDILGKDDPVVQRLADILGEHYASEGKSVYGQGKHFKPKQGIKGFEGDRPDRSSIQNAQDLFDSQIAYLRSAYGWSYMQDAVKNVKEVLKNPELQETRPNMLQWMRDDVRNAMGFGTIKWLRSGEEAFSKMLGEIDAGTAKVIRKVYPGFKGMPTDTSSIYSGVGSAKSLFYTMVLGGFNLPFMLVSMTQPVFSMPHHIKLTQDGYNHNPIRSSVEGLAKMYDALLYHNAKNKGSTDIADRVMANNEPIWKDAISYIETNGILELNQFSEVGKSRQGVLSEGVEKFMNWGISKPEMASRTLTFMTFVSHLAQSGKFKDSISLLQKAEDMTNIVMANYKHFERAGIFAKTGLAGNMAGTLQTFTFNQWNQIGLLAKNVDWKNPKTATPIASLLALQMGMGGLLGFYGIETASDILEWFKKGMIELNGSIPTWLQNFHLKKAVIDNLPQWVSYGALSNATGLNFSSRMNMGTLPGFGDNAMMPFLSYYSNAAEKVGKLVMDPTSTSKQQLALMATAPSSVRGFLDVEMFGDKSRVMRDPTGNYIHQRTPEEMNIRRTGFVAMPEARAKDREYYATQQDVTRSKNMKGIAEQMESMIRSGNMDDFEEKMQQYIAAGGNPQSFFASLPQRLQAQFLSRQQALGMKATTPGSVLRYQERQ